MITYFQAKLISLKNKNTIKQFFGQFRPSEKKISILILMPNLHFCKNNLKIQKTRKHFFNVAQNIPPTFVQKLVFYKESNELVLSLMNRFFLMRSGCR